MDNSEIVAPQGENKPSGTGSPASSLEVVTRWLNENPGEPLPSGLRAAGLDVAMRAARAEIPLSPYMRALLRISSLVSAHELGLLKRPKLYRLILKKAGIVEVPAETEQEARWFCPRGDLIEGCFEAPHQPEYIYLKTVTYWALRRRRVFILTLRCERIPEAEIRRRCLEIAKASSSEVVEFFVDGRSEEGLVVRRVVEIRED